MKIKWGVIIGGFLGALMLAALGIGLVGAWFTAYLMATNAVAWVLPPGPPLPWYAQALLIFAFCWYSRGIARRASALGASHARKLSSLMRGPE